MKPETEKARESRLRRLAESRGLRLVKSRRGDPGAIGFARYMLVDALMSASALTLVFEATLDDIERQLSRTNRGTSEA